MMVTDTMTATLRELAPFVRPGFAECWRRLAGEAGYKRLAHAAANATGTADATNGVQTRRGNGRATTKGPICRWGRKVSRSGNVTRNRRHVCSEVCDWTDDQCFAWLETQSRLDYTGWASCLCGASARYHVEPKANPDGTLAGYGEIKCEYREREAVAPNL